jgi:oligoendopeptidase F
MTSKSLKNIKTKAFLDYLNNTYYLLHKSYEDAFWNFRMGIRDDGEKMNRAEAKRDAFRSNKELKKVVEEHIKKNKGKLKKRLEIWNKFFGLFQIPDEAVPIRKKVAELEEKVLKVHSTRKEGYIDPKNGTFIEASRNKMRTMMRTHPEESIRKACFEAIEKLPLETLDDYIQIIKYRNEYARVLGYEDFYDYKIHLDEGISKDKLFSIFEKIYEKTKYAFENVREMEKTRPGLRKPWNFGYMLTGDFTKEEDPYFKFEKVLNYWGRSFSSLGIDYKGGELTLDLLNRQGKWDNGFCHYPKLVRYDKKGKIQPGSSNFTSEAIPSQVGSGEQAVNTVFHEAGHAADRLNSIQEDVCINTEYPPSTVSWAETHSMFMDSISGSIEWRVRYAKDEKGNSYPFDLFERELKTIYPLRPLEMMSIHFVMDFERQIYECKNLTKEFVLDTARRVYQKFFDRSEDSLMILNVPHIYSWESSAYYHGYGLAELGVHQWREYFFKKYGYIVDNPKVGREMEKVWKYGSLYTSGEFIKMATGKPLSADAFIKNVTKPLEQIIKIAKERIKRLEKIPMKKGLINLNAKINLIHGKEKVADNRRSFEEMDRKYREWLRKQK